MEDKRAHERISVLEAKVTNMELSLDENTRLTKETATNTKELVTLMRGAKGARAFLVWITPIAATIGIVYTFVKDHWK